MPARLVSSALQSLDGFREDVDGRFDWGTPDAEPHGCIILLHARTFGSGVLHLHHRVRTA